VLSPALGWALAKLIRAHRRTRALHWRSTSVLSGVVVFFGSISDRTDRVAHVGLHNITLAGGAGGAAALSAAHAR